MESEKRFSSSVHDATTALGQGERGLSADEAFLAELGYKQEVRISR